MALMYCFIIKMGIIENFCFEVLLSLLLSNNVNVTPLLVWANGLLQGGMGVTDSAPQEYVPIFRCLNSLSKSLLQSSAGLLKINLY